jgi:hypothetical protein
VGVSGCRLASEDRKNTYLKHLRRKELLNSPDLLSNADLVCCKGLPASSAQALSRWGGHTVSRLLSGEPRVGAV